MNSIRTVIAVLPLWAASGWAAVPATADREIQYLFEFVADSGCSFERNGSSHDSADAADHLRLKYRRGSRYVNTAEQFIDRLASESSWTGKAYTVTCDGETRTSNRWLHRHTPANAYAQRAEVEVGKPWRVHQ